MKVVNHKPLNQIAQRHDKIRGASNPDNGVEDFIVILLLIRNI